MVGLYFVLLMPVGFSLLVLIRPEMSPDDSPELVVLAVVLILLVPFGVSAFVRRKRPAARAFELALATLLAALGVLAMAKARPYLAGEPLDPLLLLGGYIGLAVMMLPGALLGSWWGGRTARSS